MQAFAQSSTKSLMSRCKLPNCLSIQSMLQIPLAPTAYLPAAVEQLPDLPADGAAGGPARPGPQRGAAEPQHRPPAQAELHQQTLQATHWGVLDAHQNCPGGQQSGGLCKPAAQVAAGTGCLQVGEAGEQTCKACVLGWAAFRCRRSHAGSGRLPTSLAGRPGGQASEAAASADKGWTQTHAAHICAMAELSLCRSRNSLSCRPAGAGSCRVSTDELKPSGSFAATMSCVLSGLC